MNPEARDWIRKMFKKNKVWMAVDEQGQPLVRSGRVLIKYQRDQDYEYWIDPAQIKEIPAGSETSVQKPRKRKAAGEKTVEPRLEPDHPENTIIIYTDGASSGNPGPAGIGIVMRYGAHEREISKYIGEATNNVAELEAVRTALAELKRTDLPVWIYTDSTYVQGLLISGWKAQKNKPLIDSIRKLCAAFSDLHIIKVKGHSGVSENERADELATSAIDTHLKGEGR